MRSPTLPIHHDPSGQCAPKKPPETFGKTADSILFGLTGLLALVAAVLFTISQAQMRFRCILFGKMFELKRLVIPGPIYPCWFYTISLYSIAFLSMALAFMAARTSSFMFYNVRVKIIVFAVPVVLLVDIFLIREGLHSLCDSFDVNKICESEVFHNTDFKVFRPKHLDAGYFYDDCHKAMLCCGAVLLLWIGSVLVHCRKHKRALISLPGSH